MIDHLNLPLVSIDRELTVLLIALLFDGATRLLFPDFRDRMAPLGGVIAALSLLIKRKLNRDYRDDKTLFIRGFFALIFILSIAYGVAFFLERLISGHPRGQVISVLIVFSCFSFTMPWTAASKMIKALKTKDGTVSALLSILDRRLISHDLQLKKADRHAVARTVIQAIARSVDRGFMAVAFWYCVPALFGYSGIITLLMAVTVGEAARIMSNSRFEENGFSLPFVTLDTIIHYIPARLGALLLWVAMIFAPNCYPFSSIKCLIKQSREHLSINAGWPISVIAGGLRIALSSGNSKKQWIGVDQATARVTHMDIRHALTLHYIVFILSVLLISSLLFLSLGLS